MNDGDERQQQECEDERRQRDLEALKHVAEAGLIQDAELLASELGLMNEFQQLRRVA